MTHERPISQWNWIGKLVMSMFLLVLGGLANQFWNIPVQQMHQDDRLNAIEKHMEYNDQRLDRFERQLDIMGRQMDDLKVMHVELLKRPAKKK